MRCRTEAERGRRGCARWRERMLARCAEWETTQSQRCADWEAQQEQRCDDWRERREQQCTEWEHRQEQQCSQWEEERRKECDGWHPLLSWLCVAFVWVTTTVCRAWTWVTTSICRVWTWVVVEVFCALWTVITTMVCRLWVLVVSIVCRAWVLVVDTVCTLWVLITTIPCLILCGIRQLFAGDGEISETRSECVFSWTSRFRIVHDEKGCVLRVEVRIRLNPAADVTDEEFADARARWEQGIEDTWNAGPRLRRTSGDCRCEEYRIEYDVQWVETGEHHVVQVPSGSGRSDMGNWFVEDPGSTAAHEFGHMLGNPDEYPEPDRCPDRVTTDDDSVMASGGTVHVRHVQRIADWISDATCCDYEPVEG